MKLSSEMLKNLSYINIKKSQSLEVELVNFHADWRPCTYYSPVNTFSNPL